MPLCRPQAGVRGVGSQPAYHRPGQEAGHLLPPAQVLLRRCAGAPGGRGGAGRGRGGVTRRQPAARPRQAAPGGHGEQAWRTGLGMAGVGRYRGCVRVARPARLLCPSRTCHSTWLYQLVIFPACLPPRKPSSRPPSLPAPQPRQMVLLRNDGNQPLLFTVAHDLPAAGLGGELRRRSDDDESAAAAAQQLLEVRPVRGVVPPGQDVQLQVGRWQRVKAKGWGCSCGGATPSGGAVGRRRTLFQFAIQTALTCRFSPPNNRCTSRAMSGRCAARCTTRACATACGWVAS